jgi:hypothetical protein
MIVGTMARLLTIRHPSHEWSQGRSQQEKLTDINSSGIEATSHQATDEQEMGTRNKQLYQISNDTLLQSLESHMTHQRKTERTLRATCACAPLGKQYAS